MRSALGDLLPSVFVCTLSVNLKMEPFGCSFATFSSVGRLPGQPWVGRTTCEDTHSANGVPPGNLLPGQVTVLPSDQLSSI